MKRQNGHDSGFTIIEVLIVLAIAALILLIVFMAVPALQRNSRNTRRKSAVTFALTTVTQYYVDRGEYPFVVNGIPDPAVWDDYYNSYIKGTPMDGYTYNILPLNTTDLSYVGPPDEITFSTGHWCNKDPASDDSIAGDGKREKDVVIWTKIEGSNKVYCADNSTGLYTP